MWRELGLLAVLAATAISATKVVCDRAPRCDASACQRPDCICSGDEPQIDIFERPQLIYLTYDDAFTELAHTQFYEPIFNGAYKNPNGCNIRATHFLTQQSTDWHLAHKYWAAPYGHEMASHSITHRSNTTYWQLLDKDGWKDELDGLRTIASEYGFIDSSTIIGTRAPYLQGGGEEQFTMMEENNFEYDCTMPSRAYGYVDMDEGLWPFTLDYRSQMDCQIQPCPYCSYPGIWVQPMLDLEDSWFEADPTHPDQGNPCAMLDSCIIPNNNTADAVFAMLKRNFDRAYYGRTRAPFGLYMHAAWFFGQEHHYIGYKMFLDYATGFNDTWIVPIASGIEYMKNPVPNDQVGNLDAFKCEADSYPAFNCDKSTACKFENVVNDDFEATEIYMQVCGTYCPVNYPWLGNPYGD